MYFNTKFNIRLLLCVAACTMCWTIAFADSTDTNTAVKVNSSSYQDWADRTDISAKVSNQSQANIWHRDLTTYRSL